MNELFGIAYTFARAVWRRRWWVVITAWAVALPAWAFVLLQPDRFEASARVFVDARTPLRQGLEGIAIQGDFDSQLALVRESLLSRPQLEAVARQTNLDANVSSAPEMDMLMSDLVKKISVRTLAAADATGQSRGGGSIYTITYENPDRQKAVAVVRTLLENFQQGTDGGSRTGANEAQEFYKNQIAQYERQLQEAEQRLADFQKNNVGLIPGEENSYSDRLRQAMSGLQETETALAVSHSQRAALQRQLAGVRTFVPGTSGASGDAGSPLDVTQRILVAERKLEELLLKYTDSYYEVTETRRTIAELKKREAAELADLQRGGAGTGAIRSLAANPVHQRIQQQLSEIQVQIAAQEGAIQQRKQEIANLRRVVDQSPEIQQQFSQLNRDYTTIKDQYGQLVSRREQAKLTDSAVRAGIVSFDVIEPPRVPFEPSAPNRPLLFAICLGIALAAGVAIAALPQLLRPTFTDVDMLHRALGVPVLGAVSASTSPRQRAKVRKDALRAVLVGVALMAFTGVLAVAGTRLARLVQQVIT